LTTNSALSRAAFHYEKRIKPGWFFSAVVTDYHLSHLAWLKSPMEVPDLPRAEILASCYATMRPHESFWNRYLTEIDRLKTENKMSQRDHEVLRFSLNAADELMDVTRGDVEGITDKNIHVVLAKLEKTYAAEKEEALQKERSANEYARKQITELETNLREKEQKLAAANNSTAAEQLAQEGALVTLRAQVTAAKQALDAQENQLSGLTAQLNTINERDSHRRALLTYIFILVLVLLLSGFSGWSAQHYLTRTVHVLGVIFTAAAGAIPTFIIAHFIIEVWAKRHPPIFKLWPFKQMKRFRRQLWALVILSFGVGVAGNLVANSIQKTLDEDQLPKKVNLAPNTNSATGSNAPPPSSK
jgi:hypothetical protein